MLSPPLSAIREYRDRLPTTDLYFLNPIAYLKRREPQAAAFPRTRFLVQNVYLIGRTGVIVRYGSARGIERLERAGANRIVYIADDDFAAGAADPGLPESYRARLAAFVEEGWPAVRSAADIVVVPGTILAEAYGQKAFVVPPAWLRLPAGTDHFSHPRGIEIVHLGTGSHSADLARIAPAAAEVLAAHPNARLTLFCGAAIPSALQGGSRLRARRPMRWWRYKLMLPRMRFHLALYPLEDTAFNRARSANKLFEQALVGAASLMSSNPALREAAGPELEDIFLEGDPEEWRARIAAEISDPERLRARASATRSRILALDPLGQSARRWLEILAPET
jgi:hypothetical protein